MIVHLHPLALKAWPWLPAELPAGAVAVGPGGPVLRVRPDGGCDEVLPGGHPRPGPASDPCASRISRPDNATPEVKP